MAKRKKTSHHDLSVKATDEQLHALWAVVVEMGDDGVKGYVHREMSARIKLGYEEEIRGVTFPIPGTGAYFEGAIVHKDRSDNVDGRLYATREAFASAWRAIDTKTGIPPWKK